MAEKTFTISCTMEERWINHFLSFLNYMEFCGKIGHSSLIGFYSDGDGDFRPNFDIDIEYEKKKGYWSNDVELSTPEVIFDAG